MTQISIALAASDDRSVRRLMLDQIRRRDPLAEGGFWYSVVTTGVYCRPACPSRRALPQNIRLHDTLAEARATGFRPCARCHPEGPSQADRHWAMIENVCALILSAEPAPSSRALARAVGLSPSQLYRVFQRVTGMPPKTYAQSQRAKATPKVQVAQEPRSIGSGAGRSKDLGPT